MHMHTSVLPSGTYTHTHLFVVHRVSDVDAGPKRDLLDGRVEVDEVALDAHLGGVEVQPLQQGGLAAAGHPHHDAHHRLFLPPRPRPRPRPSSLVAALPAAGGAAALCRRVFGYIREGGARTGVVEQRLWVKPEGRYERCLHCSGDATSLPY